MHEHFAVERIPFSRIDWQDTTFSLSPVEDELVPEPLAAAISRVGRILHPPIVRKKAAAIQIVSGRKRLLAAREILKLQACNCLILPGDLPAEELFTIRLEDATTFRDLSPVEQAVFLAKAGTVFAEADIVRIFLPLLGLARQPFRIHRLLALLDLEEPLLSSLDRGLLDEAAARDLLELSFRDRMVLFEIIRDLKLSTGNQRKLVASCRELAGRLRTTIAEILTGPGPKQILEHPGANAPQKGGNLMAWLQAQRLPRYSEAEKEFRRLVGSLGLPRGTALGHSPYFEKDTLTLTVTFKNQDDFLKYWPGVRNALPE
ncbi:MAG: hypothetical protein L3J03_00150 [Desulfobacterales bacterium]|nr:hypothetical protein [Desulfobacterales bacterium]